MDNIFVFGTKDRGSNPLKGIKTGCQEDKLWTKTLTIWLRIGKSYKRWSLKILTAPEIPGIKFISKPFKNPAKSGKKRKKALVVSRAIFLIFIFLSIFSGIRTALNPSSEPLPINMEISAEDSFSDSFAEPARLSFEEYQANFIQNNTLTSASPPNFIEAKIFGNLDENYDYNEIPAARKAIVSYPVKSGDTLETIAKDFSVSLDSLLWANNLSRKSKVKIGQELIVPPVSGVIHYVKSGETLEQIAKLYKAEKTDIVSFNEISQREDIVIGDILVVPNGVLPTVPAKRPSITQKPIGASYFIVPTKGKISQGLHFNNAVDFSNDCGMPIVSAAQGKVLKVKYGWNNGAGNYLTILHPNGIATSYGHILKALVEIGDEVSQGQIIALIGGKSGTPGAGISTGCHVHFSVIGGKNPFSK